MTLFGNVHEEISKIQKTIATRKEPKVGKEYKDYIEIVQEEGSYKIKLNSSLVNENAKAKGFSAIATSKDMTAEECDSTYNL